MAIESGCFQDVTPIKNQIFHCYVSLLACNIFFILLMEGIGHLDVKNPENSGINYQPQLVIAGFLKHQHYESRMVQTIQPSENAAQALVGLDDRLAELFPRNGPGTQGNESHGSTTHPYLSLDLEFRSVCNIVFIYIYIYVYDHILIYTLSDVACYILHLCTCFPSESSDSLNSAVLWNDGKPFQNPWTIVFLDVKKWHIWHHHMIHLDHTSRMLWGMNFPKVCLQLKSMQL